MGVGVKGGLTIDCADEGRAADPTDKLPGALFFPSVVLLGGLGGWVGG